MTDLLRKFVKPGITVCDPFCGGGSTAVAALKLGAIFIGMDKDDNAIQITKGRINTIAKNKK